MYTVPGCIGLAQKSYLNQISCCFFFEVNTYLLGILCICKSKACTSLFGFFLLLNALICYRYVFNFIVHFKQIIVPVIFILGARCGLNIKQH